ncbi:hypothetical protein [Candidatus Tisiphia endosymbiont of Parasteatoda lunata]|uniref:hypothetical protein n=1 Tax=Candidatus Tisiphia endosymbiont of Parasteatoda lunata TaxID=3066275 RepID=UPI00313B1599
MTGRLVGNDSACIEEGERYIESLAKDYGIKLNKAQPFIQYKTQEECPLGLFPRRFYPNYASSNERKLTEDLMSSDLVNKFLNKDQVRTPSQSERLDGYEQPKGLPLLIKILLIRQSLNYQVALDS